MIELTQEIVHDLIEYIPSTGECFWKERKSKWFKSNRMWSAEQHSIRWNTRFSGCAVGGKDTKGYLAFRMLGKDYRLHRIAWLYMTGEWPDQVDHIDGDRSNNKWENLRSVTNCENKKNSKLYTNNTSGFIGIYWENRLQKWCARISYEGKNLYLGVFEKLSEAVKVRKEAEIKYGYHPNHGR